MQLKWTRLNSDYSMKAELFDYTIIIRPSCPWSPIYTWEIVRSDLFPEEPLKEGFKTKEEAMVAAHQIIEKELEKGYVGNAWQQGEFSAKLSYIPEDMFGCKKALALFTNENGDEYIDSALISVTIPKGSLVREVDPKHHDELPATFGVCRKCRSDKAIIVDILDPMYLRQGELTNLPSRKTLRKKIPIISVHIVDKALNMYFNTQESFYGYTVGTRAARTYRNEYIMMRKLVSGYMSVILGFNNDARIFGEWLSKITKPQFPVPYDLVIAAKLLDPYEDVAIKYQNDSYMFCKVLLARILREIGIMDIALKQSYKIGDKIQIDNFDLSNNACGAGFHFFKTAIEAQNYKFN